MRHIEKIEARNARVDARLLDELKDENTSGFAINPARRRYATGGNRHEYERLHQHRSNVVLGENLSRQL